MQDALCDVLKGYKPASVVRIPNAGHLVNLSWSQRYISYPECHIGCTGTTGWASGCDLRSTQWLEISASISAVIPPVNRYPFLTLLSGTYVTLYFYIALEGFRETRIV